MAESVTSALALLIEEACVIPTDLVQRKLVGTMYQPYLLIKAQRYIRQFAIRLSGRPFDIGNRTCPTTPSTVLIDIDLSQSRQSHAPLDDQDSVFTDGHDESTNDCKAASQYAHILFIKVAVKLNNSSL